MARLWSSGFELNSIGANVEITAVTSSNPSIVTSPVRSGTYALRSNPTSLTENSLQYKFASSNQAARFFYRIYVRFAAFPVSANQDFCSIQNTSGTIQWSLNIQSAGIINIYDKSGIKRGNDSATLSLDTWYRVELDADTTTLASSVLNAYLEGTNFATHTQDLSSSGQAIFCMGNATLGQGMDCYIDDVAINNSTGSFQNSLPGAGEIKHLRPNAAGDNAQWVPTSGTNWSNVSEVTPDDATTEVTNVSVVNTLDDYNLDASGLTSNDSITLVQVGLRLKQGAVANSDKVRIKASSGGTVESSANITEVDTNWHTNAEAAPFNYPLTLYDLPGASTTAWTAADLDVTQIGLEHTGGSVTASEVSTMWLLVEFVTGGAATSTSTTTTTTSTSSSTTSTTTSTSTTSTTSSTSTTRSTSTTSTTTSSSTSTTSTTTSTTSSTSTTSTTRSTSTTSTTTSSSTSTTSTTSSTSTTRSTSTTSTSSSTTQSVTTSTTTTSSSTSTTSTTTSSSTSTSTTTSSSTSTTISTSTSSSTTQTWPYFLSASLV